MGRVGEGVRGKGKGRLDLGVGDCGWDSGGGMTGRMEGALSGWEMGRNWKGGMQAL